MESHGNTKNEPLFLCPICEQNFYLGSNLRNHVEVAHYVLKDAPGSKVKRRRHPKKFAKKGRLPVNAKTPAKGINKKKSPALKRSTDEMELENTDNCEKQRANCSTSKQTHLDISFEENPIHNSMVVIPIGGVYENKWLIKECRVVLRRLPDEQLTDIQRTGEESVNAEGDNLELPLNQYRAPSPVLLENTASPDSCTTSKETEDGPSSSPLFSDDQMNENKCLIKECRVILHRLPDSQLNGLQRTDKDESIEAEQDDWELPLNQCRTPSPVLLKSKASPDTYAISKETVDPPCSSQLFLDDRDEFDDSKSDISLF